MLEGILVVGLVYGIMTLGVFISFRILDFADLTVASLTKRFVSEFGLTALIVTHDMKRVRDQAERVVMMHE